MKTNDLNKPLSAIFAATVRGLSIFLPSIPKFIFTCSMSGGRTALGLFSIALFSLHNSF